MGKTVPKDGGMKLLWSNPSPYSSYGGGTVSVDLSKYKLICIMFVAEAGKQNALNGQVFPVGASCMAIGVGRDSGAVTRRYFTTAADKVSFGGASYDANSGNNTLLVPHSIYGVK